MFAFALVIPTQPFDLIVFYCDASIRHVSGAGRRPADAALTVFAQPPDGAGPGVVARHRRQDLRPGHRRSKILRVHAAPSDGLAGSRVAIASSWHQNAQRLNAPYTPVYSFDRNTRKLTVHAKPSGQAKNGWPLVLTAIDDATPPPKSAISSALPSPRTFTVTFDGYPVVTLPAGGLNFTVGETVNEKLQTYGQRRP